MSVNNVFPGLFYWGRPAGTLLVRQDILVIPVFAPLVIQLVLIAQTQMPIQLNIK